MKRSHLSLRSVFHRIIPKIELLEDRATPTLFSGEFQANTTVLYNQRDSASASSPKGHVVVWTSLSASGQGAEIYAQRWTTGYAKLGPEIHITASPAFDFNPNVCMDNSGNFVVTWTTSFSTGNQNVLMARYDAAGQLKGTVVSVANSAVKEHSASIACSGTGEFVISYTHQVSASNYDVLAKRYSAKGTLLQTINVATTWRKEQTSQVVRSKGPNAVFDIVYRSTNDIHLKRFSSIGALVGSPVVIAATSAVETNPSIAMDNAGNAVVGWEETGSVKARRMSASGTLSTVFVVRAYTYIDSSDPVLGEFTTSSSSFGSPQVVLTSASGSFAIAYQQYFNLSTNGPLIPVNESTVGWKEYSASGSVIRDVDLASYSGISSMGNMYPSASINPLGYFLVTYTKGGEDVYFRRGRLI